MKNKQRRQASFGGSGSYRTTQIQYPALSDCYEETISPIMSCNRTIPESSTHTDETAPIISKMTSEIPSALTLLEHLLPQHTETQPQQSEIQDFMDCFMR